MNVAGNPSRRLTVAVCTFRRPELLSRALASLTRGSNPEFIAETIVVDNDPQETIALDSLPTGGNVRLLRSSPPGLSRARNVALRGATGGLIAYIDDDVQVSDQWAKAITLGFDSADIQSVGGPVRPLWRTPPPHWLGDSLEYALSMLDKPASDVDLQDGQYLIGANMAFNVETLRQIGGFQADLGRTGTSLMGNEEHGPQDQIRSCGGRIRLVAGAEVLHEVAPSRTTWSWFIKRFAWQAVSDVASGAASRDRYYFDELVRTTELQALPELFREPVEQGSDSQAKAALRLQTVRALMTIALLDGEVVVPDQSSESDSAPTTTRHEPGVSGLPRHRPIIPETNVDVVFAEVLPGHSYLYEGLATPASLLISQDFDVWEEQDHEERIVLWLGEALTAAETCRAPCFLLSLDPLARPHLVERVRSIIESHECDVFGIVHRAPTRADGRAALRALADSLEGVLAFDKEMVEELERSCGLRGAIAIDHPSGLRSVNLRTRGSAKRRLGIPEDRTTFSVLGDLRPGKGVGALIEGISALADYDRAFLILAGRGDANMRSSIQVQAQQAGIATLIDVRESHTNRHYAVLTDGEYADLVAATDVGVLLYQEEQARIFSGNLPNYVLNRSSILASRDSVVGRVVSARGLGVVVDPLDPHDTGTGVRKLLKMHAKYPAMPQYKSYRSSLSKDNATAHLLTVLGRRG